MQIEFNDELYAYMIDMVSAHLGIDVDEQPSAVLEAMAVSSIQSIAAYYQEKGRKIRHKIRVNESIIKHSPDEAERTEAIARLGILKAKLSEAQAEAEKAGFNYKRVLKPHDARRRRRRAVRNAYKE